MLIDAHAHMDRFGPDLEEALTEIQRHRILTVGVAMDPPSWAETRRIADRCDFVVPAIGVHPWNAPDYADRLPDLAPAIEDSVMIGEIGLDFHWVEDKAAWTGQRKVLDFFLAAAADQDKAVNLHTKGAEEEILESLRRYNIRRAIVHWYSGPLELIREFVGLGSWFTIGLEVLHSDHIRAVARAVPSHLLLTETDNPGGPAWLTGSPGRPGLILDVVQALAEIKQVTGREMEEIVTDNFIRLIGRDQALGRACQSLWPTPDKEVP